MAFETAPIINALRRVLPEARGPYHLSEPHLQGKEWSYVKDCLDSGWVSSVGKYVDRFEQELAQYTSAGHAVVTVNGTAALHVALVLAGVVADDEVLVPALSFVATTNTVAYCHAVPHFVDCDESTLGVDAHAVDEYLADIARVKDGLCINRHSGRIIRALVVMHTFGHPADLDALSDLCEKYCLQLVEDAAEALGSRYKGRHVGHHGCLGALSFNGNKIITTGGGGAILTDDARVARHAKHLTTTAKLPHPWRFDHDEIAYNYRMPNLNAALGCAQLQELPQKLEQRLRLHQAYEQALAGLEGVTLVKEVEHCRSNHWLQAIALDNDDEETLQDFLAECHRQGILARPAWTLQNRLPMYQQAPSMPTFTAERLSRQLVNLPSSVILGEEV